VRLEALVLRLESFQFGFQIFVCHREHLDSAGRASPPAAGWPAAASVPVTGAMSPAPTKFITAEDAEVQS
jgi:hypothetical protein